MSPLTLAVAKALSWLGYILIAAGVVAAIGTFYLGGAPMLAVGGIALLAALFLGLLTIGFGTNLRLLHTISTRLDGEGR
jgi:ABC-type multidrug transport system permease subunit